ncbi:YdaU family protein [Sinorhizobium chiapasense]|uniref:DUF1376 domain-containing protein n=1 Tax=Sinorhizobium chiapasense TaxID=501572 RepID=A0ABZ2BGN7_9HYPH
MSARPFMQLYVSDFIGDTLHLSTEQIGAYMLLLMAMWNAGGRLPSDDAKLARVARVSLKKWKSMAAELMPFFDVDGDDIVHGRLTEELQKSERKSQSRAAAGSKGGTAKSLKYKKALLANAMLMPQHFPDTIYNKKNTHTFPYAETAGEQMAVSRSPQVAPPPDPLRPPQRLLNPPPDGDHSRLVAALGRRATGRSELDSLISATRRRRH